MTTPATASTDRLPFQDPVRPINERVKDLVGRLTLDEKIEQMLYTAPAIERLGIPAYNWWNEALHGVGRAGIATVFPQAIGLAATWNVDLIGQIANVIADEGRAKFHDTLRRTGETPQYHGITYWSPNINIFRDPRWGRGQETYGEDPYLTARLGVAFVRGLQGDDPQTFKTIATPKHYAVHSGPEPDRHHFNADCSDRDLRETYLAAFKATVVEGGAWSVMGAYNRFRGEPCCASPLLLQTILRDQWGFKGYIVSDCGAIEDIHLHHKVVETAEEAAALAVHTGCDLCCGGAYAALKGAVEQGLIDEATIDESVGRLFEARIRLGMFDPPEEVPYANTPIEVVDSPAHRALALQAARESIVLLKNDGLLPLDEAQIKRLAVIGPNADDAEVLLGNYNGTPSDPITPLRGLRERATNAEVVYARGCGILGDDRSGFDEAVRLASESDVAVLVLGLSQLIEGEEGQEEGVSGGQRTLGDRTRIDLPPTQQALLEAVHATGTPVVLVILSGSAVAVNWAHEHVPAIIQAWYPGQAGGTALAEVLFGDVNPAGRLPVTIYRSVDQLPPFTDYSMAGRTYRYFTGEPLYAFGHGLSYTRFEYSDLVIAPGEASAGQPVSITATVTNAGEREGDEVVQLYVTDREASVPVPVRQLGGFLRVHLRPGESRTITFTLAPDQLAVFLDDGRRVVEPGVFEVAVGGKQPGAGGGADAPTTSVVTGQFTVTGEPFLVETFRTHD